MTPQRPKYLQYRIVRIRLVNFHNFVNETIEIRNGGHLFLLGPNGSGKSTVIDAVHVVLTGSQEIELNAAARLGGRRDEGRTLQGVVLRYDRELGVLNQGGGISYAALELASLNGEKRVALGIGIEATTMEARTTRWGFIVKDCGVAELPLVIDELQGPRPATKLELEQRLGKAYVYPHYRYRKLIAEEFFASESLYDQVAHLWNTGKAYREICARAGDFQNLFMQLLPEPDKEIFDEIIRSLTIIQDFNSKLAQLEEQLRYLERLMALQETIQQAREDEARYDWLIVHRELSSCKERLTFLQTQSDDVQARVQRNQATLSKLLGEREQIKQWLADLRRKDQAHLLERLQAKKQELERQSQALRRQHEQLQAFSRQLRQALQETETLRADLVAQLSTVREELSVALEDARDLPMPEHVRVLTQEFIDANAETLAQQAEPVSGKMALAVTNEQLAQMARREMALQQEIKQHQEACNQIQLMLDNLLQQREWLPQLPEYGRCLQRLEQHGFTPQPLYKMLEWRTTDSDLRSAIEELLGEQVLGTLVLNSEAQDIRAIILNEFPGIPMAVASDGGVKCPAWILEALDDRSNGMALAVLADALAAREHQDPEFLAEQKQLAIRGMRWRAESKPAKLIGAEARRKAFDEQRLRLERELADEQAEMAARQNELEQNSALTLKWNALERGWQKLSLPSFLKSFHEHRSAIAAAARAQSTHEELARTYTLSSEEHEALAAEIDQLEQQIVAAGLQDLSRQLSEAEERERQLEHELQAVTENKGRLENEMSKIESDLSAWRHRRVELEGELLSKASALRLFVPEDMAPSLEYYVLETRGGEKFKTTEAILRRKAGAHDQLNTALAQLQGTGEDGIHYRQYSGIFGFSYDLNENRIVDRQHQPIQGVLNRLKQDLGEQKEILNEKNKDLLDRLIMDSLSRHLTEQVVQQDDMIRGINKLLEKLDFDGTVYEFAVRPKSEFREIVDLVRRLSLFDESRRQNFRAFIEARLDDLSSSEPGEVPQILDYRFWFDYKLTFRDTKQEATELTRKMRTLGSGGEQAVPNYLLVIAMSHLVFQNSKGRIRPMLFDEAFYGIDAGRRDRLLEFSTRLGMQLFVASPDQDGHTPAAPYATSVFVRKDENRDVHLVTLHSHHPAKLEVQNVLFEVEASSGEMKEEAAVNRSSSKA